MILPIVECITLCGKQEISLRWHRDFGPIDFTGKLILSYIK